MSDILGLKGEGFRFSSATHEEIRSGATTDAYFVKTRTVLASVGKLDTEVTAEVFSRKSGVFAGLDDLLELLRDRDVTIEAIPQGEGFEPRETLLRIRGAYGAFGLFETPLLGFLASASGWATAARECVDAALGKPVLSFGARHIHPAVAPAMDKAAIRYGGCINGSCVLGAALCGMEASGTVPHAAVLIMGDTLSLAHAYDSALPAAEKRIFLVDTFRDEAEESLRLGEALGERLDAVRLDTPCERGGVTADLVREVRCKLDMASFHHVKIVVSGGLTPPRIAELSAAGADIFGVGSYIAHALPIDMTLDIKEVEGKPVAKRGRLPGIVGNERLARVK